MRVAIVGSGYVGLVTAVGLAELGHDVICVDKDAEKVDWINRGKSPIFEPGLEDLLKGLVGSRLHATTIIDQAISQSDLSMITVDTPFDGEQIRLDSVAAVTRSIGQALESSHSYHVVIVKSTVIPGTTEDFVLPILEAHSGRRAGEGFGLGANPEFLREGRAVADFLNPDRLVLGAIDERSREALVELYSGFDRVELVNTTPRTAEMIKYASNSLLATLISFSNEIANLAAEVGVDAHQVMRAVHLDKRLMPFGEDRARIRPGILAYLEPGCGFGGSCFPKDVRSFVRFGEERDVPMRILRSVMQVNDAQPSKMIDLLHRHLEDPRGRDVTVLGLAFKPETDDVRESPGLTVTERLLEMGARVTVFDPVAQGEAAKSLGDRVDYATDLDDAVAHAEAILLMTAWSDFEDVPRLVASRSPQPVVVDGRGLWPVGSLERLESIGR